MYIVENNKEVPQEDLAAKIGPVHPVAKFETIPLKDGYIYGRFSSDRQDEVSIEAQIRACRDYAAAHGINIVGIYTDEAISGKGSKTAKRVQYQKMLRDAERNNIDVILIHKYDRIARNLGEHVNLESKLNAMGITLIATAQDFGTSNEAKIMRTLMWSLSEYYIDNLASETRKGHKEAALKGLHNGGVAPFGYDVVNQRYVINEFEALYVRKIFDAALNRQGFTELLQEMEQCGVKGKRGKPLKYTQIYEMLRNEKYTGTYLYCVEEEKDRTKRRQKPDAIKLEGAMPAIIDRKTFEEVQQIMNERKQTGIRGNYLCSGLVYCSCGAKMHAAKSTRKGHTYVYYACSERCGVPRTRMETVDNAVKSYLNNLLSDENQAEIALALKRYKQDEKERTADFKKILRQKINEKEQQYETLMTNLSSTVAAPEVVADIAARMQSLKNEIEQLKNAEPPKDYTESTVKDWLQSLKSCIDTKAVRILVERVEIKNKTEINVKSTLESVLCKIGCRGAQHILPQILFEYHYIQKP